MKILTMLSLVLLMSSQLIADDEEDYAAWGPKEILMVGQAATDTLKANMGETIYNGTTAVSVELSIQKNSAKANIVYEENGVKKTKAYFCHQHNVTQIDCH
jgi:hypothetical protein